MYYPRSFLKFILLGFLLVSLPLLYALVELIVSLDRLGTQSQQAVLQAAQAGHASRQLYEQATTLERLVRQHLILEDPQLVDDYARLRLDFRQTSQQLRSCRSIALNLTSSRSSPTAKAVFFTLLKAPKRPPNATATLAEGLRQHRRRRTGDGDRDHASDRARDRATFSETARRREQDVGLPCARRGLIALALAILFAVLIARPIRSARSGDPADGEGGLHPCDRSQWPAGHALPRPAPRMAALAAARARGTAESLSAPRLTTSSRRQLTAVREGAELLRDRVGGELSTEQQEIVRIVRENTLSLQN